MVQHDQASTDRREIARLRDEVEQLRTALETATEEVTVLVEERERLLDRIKAQARELHSATVNFSSELATHRTDTGLALADAGRSEQELGIAFEELQVLTEELEVANTKLAESNYLLDLRVDERTRELAAKNEALAASELRFRTLVEGMPQLVWRAADGGKWTWASPQWTGYTGLTLEESLGMGWLQAFHPDDRGPAMEAWGHADAGSPLDIKGRIFHSAERRYRHFRTRASPVRGEAGAILEWLGTSTDVDDLLQLQQRQQMLLAELQHRVRNMLTVVRSVFTRTLDVGGPLEEIGEHFRGRLDSLARTQVVVTQTASGLVDLENLIREELLSVAARDGAALSISGPEVALPSKTAESIGLAIHELTTNALKYGALKVAGATLDISWSVSARNDGTRQLDFNWVEGGVPAISVRPAREGFGSELINEALAYQLGAETSLQFRGGGVRCRISVPLPADDAVAAATAWKDR